VASTARDPHILGTGLKWHPKYVLWLPYFRYGASFRDTVLYLISNVYIDL